MHDVVVVGAGGSGVPFAVRAAQTGASVLLLEAGAEALPPSPAHLVPGARPGAPGTWAQHVQLAPGQSWQVQRGRGLGGSTAVNGGYFIRARSADFAAWARIGGAHWTHDSVLPLLRGLESDKTFGNTALHGHDGPMPVTRDHTSSPLARAALAAGIVADPDKNADTSVGVGPVPANVTDRHRVDVATAYLGPAHLGPGTVRPGTLHPGAPAGLDVCCGVAATRVRISNGRAVGVETTTGFVPAGQVVLCAGTIATAHLLLLSGIGPNGQLAGLGVPVISDLPVGVALSDHPQVMLPGPTGAEDSAADPVSNWLGAVVHLTSPGSTVAGNVEILESRLPVEALMAGAAAPRRSTLLVSDLTPRRRGSLRLVSPDPTVDPAVDLGYLAEHSDHATLAFAIRAAQELAGTRAPGPDPAEPEITNLGTSVHTCSSAPMGSVTDGFGRVLGVAGLRVADASLLPTAPTRGPANTAVLIGELLGRLIDT